MALETPTVMSPVGVNKEIIVDGENGYLASSTQEVGRRAREARRIARAEAAPRRCGPVRR